MKCSCSIPCSSAIVLWWLLSFQLLVVWPTAKAESDSLSANILAEYWIDARDVLEQLDNYQALWVKVHGCV
jgi:hypothetical protein